MIKDNIRHIQDDISLICRRLGKNPSDITLVCVSKTATPEKILEVIQNGITDIGENKVRDATTKFLKLQHLIKNSSQDFSVKYHMVGHLQRNKVKSALTIFDMIQSVDSLRLAQEIENHAENLNKTVDCLIEVKTSSEASKFGVKPEEALELIENVSGLKRIRIKGLMTIAPESESPEDARPYFRKLRQLSEGITQKFNSSNVQMKYLSMGMTNDYKVALEEGSNMLRIGRAIFANE